MTVYVSFFWGGGAPNILYLSRSPGSHSIPLCVSGDRAEGAEGELDNTVNNNSTTVPNTNKTTGLEGRLSFLSLRRSRNDSTKNGKRERQSRSQTPTQTVVLINGV